MAYLPVVHYYLNKMVLVKMWFGRGISQVKLKLEN